MKSEPTERQSIIARQMATLVAENGGHGFTAEEAASRLCVRKSDITAEVMEAASIRYARSGLAV